MIVGDGGSDAAGPMDASVDAPDLAHQNDATIDSDASDASLDDASDPLRLACTGYDYRGEISAGATVSGDLRVGSNHALCGSREYFPYGGFSSEHVWALHVDEPSAVRVQLVEGTNFPGVLYARRETCSDALSETGCDFDDHGSEGPRTAEHLFYALSAGTYFIFVDGLAGSHGHYVMRVDTDELAADGESCTVMDAETNDSHGRCLTGTCEPIACASNSGVCVPIVDVFAGETRCGDHVTEYPEDCDGTPGCTGACTSADSYCEDATTLPANTWVEHSVSADAPSRTRGIRSGLGAERVYRIVVEEPSLVRVNIEGATGYVRTDCDDPNTQFADAFYGTPEFTASPGEYFVFVESCGEGSARVRADLSALLANGEACDITLSDFNARCASSYCIDKAPEPRCESDALFPALCMSTADLPSISPGATLGSTRGRPNQNDGANCGGATAGDISYRLVFTEPSHVRLSVRGVGGSPLEHALLSIMPDCTTPPSSRACAMESEDGTASTSISHMPAGAYRVSVDGVDGSEGDFMLEVEVLPDLRLGERCDIIWQRRALPFGGIHGAPECESGYCLETPTSGWACKLPCAIPLLCS